MKMFKDNDLTEVKEVSRTDFEIELEMAKRDNKVLRCLGTRVDSYEEFQEVLRKFDAEGGTKYDQGKARIGEMIIDFFKPLMLVCKVWEFGVYKYDKSNWKKVENGADRYTNAMVRHLVLEETEIVDQETKIHHAIHVAWNALARLYFIIKE